MSWVRLGVLGGLLLAFAVFAFRDDRLHRDTSVRVVPRLEHLLHLLLGICILGVSGRIFRGDVSEVLPWLGAFGVLGLVDEFGYHRVVPAIEADCHAKEHLLFFLFVVVGLTWT